MVDLLEWHLRDRPLRSLSWLAELDAEEPVSSAAPLGLEEDDSFGEAESLDQVSLRFDLRLVSIVVFRLTFGAGLGSTHRCPSSSTHTLEHPC